MPIEPVKIPQNVYVEDRIIGPVTLRQIIIMLIGSGVSYALWSMMQTAGLTATVYTIFAWTPALLAAAFAFLKINDISLFRMCLLMIERMEKPRIRKWSPRTGITINIVTKKLVTDEPKKVERKSFEEDKISTLSQMLDKGPEEDEFTGEDTQDVPVATAKRAVDEEASTPKPVNKKRISVEQKGDVLDDIRTSRHTSAPAAQQTDALLRDIHPPRS